jgi:hypothetical protein
LADHDSPTSPGGTTQAALEILMGIGGRGVISQRASCGQGPRKPAIICVGIASPCAMLKQRRGIEKSWLHPNFGGNKRVAIYC